MIEPYRMSDIVDLYLELLLIKDKATLFAFCVDPLYDHRKFIVGSLNFLPLKLEFIT